MNKLSGNIEQIIRQFWTTSDLMTHKIEQFIWLIWNVRQLKILHNFAQKCLILLTKCSIFSDSVQFDRRNLNNFLLTLQKIEKFKLCVRQFEFCLSSYIEKFLWSFYEFAQFSLNYLSRWGSTTGGNEAENVDKSELACFPQTRGNRFRGNFKYPFCIHGCIRHKLWIWEDFRRIHIGLWGNLKRTNRIKLPWLKIFEGSG